MRKTLPMLGALALVIVFSSGCAHHNNTERKFGRGVMNMGEIFRGGEFRRTMEQTAMTDGPDAAYGVGFFRGINRTLARTGLGVYEVITAPFPPYEPQYTEYLAPGPVYPDNYAPGLMEDAMFSTDTNLGFSGGDVAPMVPGSRFRIFDTH